MTRYLWNNSTRESHAFVGMWCVNDWESCLIFYVYVLLLANVWMFIVSFNLATQIRYIRRQVRFTDRWVWSLIQQTAGHNACASFLHFQSRLEYCNTNRRPSVKFATGRKTLLLFRLKPFLSAKETKLLVERQINNSSEEIYICIINDGCFRHDDYHLLINNKTHTANIYAFTLYFLYSHFLKCCITAS